MKASGKTTRRAPLVPASAMSSRALATVAWRSKNTGAVCTTAILKDAMVPSGESMLPAFSEVTPLPPLPRLP
jgi:hypothetical protein